MIFSAGQQGVNFKTLGWANGPNLPITRVPKPRVIETKEQLQRIWRFMSLAEVKFPNIDWNTRMVIRIFYKTESNDFGVQNIYRETNRPQVLTICITSHAVSRSNKCSQSGRYIFVDIEKMIVKLENIIIQVIKKEIVITKESVNLNKLISDFYIIGKKLEISDLQMIWEYIKTISQIPTDLEECDMILLKFEEKAAYKYLINPKSCSKYVQMYLEKQMIENDQANDLLKSEQKFMGKYLRR